MTLAKPLQGKLDGSIRQATKDLSRFESALFNICYPYVESTEFGATLELVSRIKACCFKYSDQIQEMAKARFEEN
ncbi:MAG: hypothetical protein WCE94_15685 [Candidatus Methanoperedens sp.]